MKPELKGKIGFVSNETGVRAIGAMLKLKGEEFVKKLKAQEVILQSVSGRAMADLVVSGEVPLSPTIFRDHAIEVKGKGAPVDWVPMDVVPTNTGGVAITAQAARPHAAVLMADFLLSPEGGKDSRRPELRRSSEAYALQTLVPRSGHVDGPVRTIDGTMGEAAPGNRPQMKLEFTKSGAVPNVGDRQTNNHTFTPAV